VEGISGSEPVSELTIPEGEGLLYHYTCAKSALEGILPTSTLHLSSYRSMRDPLEYHELTSCCSTAAINRTGRDGCPWTRPRRSSGRFATGCGFSA
jgi:hypothetical protein